MSWTPSGMSKCTRKEITAAIWLAFYVRPALSIERRRATTGETAEKAVSLCPLLTRLDRSKRQPQLRHRVLSLSSCFDPQLKVTYESYMRKLHAKVTCESYIRLWTKVTCKSYSRKLHNYTWESYSRKLHNYTKENRPRRVCESYS